MNNRAVIYDDATGEILSVVTGKEDTFALDCMDGQSYLLTEEVDLYGKVVLGGELVDEDAATLEAREIAEAWVKLRKKRLRLLNKTDWTQMMDSPVNGEDWIDYRQELRDLPDNTTDPREVVWPTPPSS